LGSTLVHRRTLVHRVVLPRTPGPRPPLLVLAHGLAGDEEQLLHLADRVDPRFLVVSVRAPRNANRVGFAWYRVRWRMASPRRELAQVVESRDLLARFLEELVTATEADPARVFLLGFSQGAVLSLAVALARPGLVRGVVAHSGRLLPEVTPTAAPPGLERLEVLVLHGAADQLVHVPRGREAAEILRRLLGGPQVTYREWPDLGHVVSDESAAEAASWLAARLGP
jgi:phospholipase/carboxylesterase